MTDSWREGARSGAYDETCPGCATPAPALVWRFKKMGKHTLVFCQHCNKVHVDGDFAVDVKDDGPLAVHGKE